jgi:hypothetical protein
MVKVFILGLMAISVHGLEGKFGGAGNDPYEKATYTVEATFTKDQNGVIQATWKEVEKGKTSLYTGTGLEQKECISFIYQNTKDPTDKGLQVYQMKGDSLEGPFVALSNNLVGTEKMTRVK